MRFYQDVLGMPVSDVYPAREGRGRHAYDIGTTEITELGTFLFSDNTGILLEATWPQA
jgi:hypothetical protein